MNDPWETPEGKKIWKNKSAYFTWLRGALRRLWSDYPLRKEWKKRQLRLVTQEEKDRKIFHSSTKNVGQCYYCKEWFAGSKLECDHKEPSSGCNNKEQAQEFLWYCGGQVGSNWVLSCKPCHKIKTHAERQNISFEEASIQKKVIEKVSQPLDDQREELFNLGYTEEQISNDKKRRKCYEEVLNESR